jgi:hypothetical protein
MTVEVLQRDFYVDDLITAAPTLEELFSLIRTGIHFGSSQPTTPGYLKLSRQTSGRFSVPSLSIAVIVSRHLVCSGILLQTSF